MPFLFRLAVAFSSPGSLASSSFSRISANSSALVLVLVVIRSRSASTLPSSWALCEPTLARIVVAGQDPDRSITRKAIVHEKLSAALPFRRKGSRAQSSCDADSGPQPIETVAAKLRAWNHSGSTANCGSTLLVFVRTLVGASPWRAGSPAMVRQLVRDRLHWPVQGRSMPATHRSPRSASGAHCVCRRLLPHWTQLLPAMPRTKPARQLSFAR
jgi:hypothetical protein